MIDIHTIDNSPFENNKKVLSVKYTFKNMPYLVADKYGNIIMLNHCPKTKTIPFKVLNKSKGYIYYHSNKIRLSTLRKRMKVDNKQLEIF